MLFCSCKLSAYTNTEIGTSNTIIKRHSNYYNRCLLPVKFTSQVSIGLVVHTLIIIIIIIITTTTTTTTTTTNCRSQWPRGLRRRSTAARLLRSWVRIPPEASMSVVSVVCCQVEVSATSWSLVQRSPTDCGVSLCELEKTKSSWMRRKSRPTRGLSGHEKKTTASCNLVFTRWQ